MHVEEAQRVGGVLTDVAGLADSALIIVRLSRIDVVPHEYAVDVPARQAYSHSDSVGKT